MPVSSISRSKSAYGDDFAYLAPMVTFLAFTQIGAWWPKLFPASYIVKTILTAILLIVFHKHYTRIKWNSWWLGVIVGAVGIWQWIALQLWLQNHFDFFKPSPDVFNPTEHFQGGGLWAFIAIRMFGAVMVVPFMEELFWRDFGWRTILAPNNFKLAQVGEWGWPPFLIISALFATVHGNWWATAIVWAILIGGLLVYTKSLGACIIAHATSNLLLALYVLHTHDWSFW